MEPRERRWWERWSKQWRQRRNRWRRRWVPDRCYGLYVAWRLLRSPAFHEALWAVRDVALGGPLQRGDLMREKRAWTGLKERCAQDPAFVENRWRAVCAEREFLAETDVPGRALPVWRRMVLLELAYLIYREQY